MRQRTTFTFTAALFTLVAGCSSEPSVPTFDVPERTPGDRAPLTAACDENDPLACLLPWPSSTFTKKVDDGSPTHLRLAVEASSLFVEDDPASINRAEGFSRVTPLVTGFSTRLDPITAPPGPEGPVALILAQPDHPAYGERVPLRVEALEDNSDEANPESMLFGYPLRPLEPGADYVAVVLDDVHALGGGALPVSRVSELALGRAEPTSEDEAKIAAYHAPTRAALAKAKIDPAHVVRVWDFTTRSAEDATRRLAMMTEAARSSGTQGSVTVTIDSVNTSAGGDIAAIVEGRLGELPAFVTEEGDMTLDDGGMPTLVGHREAPFRVVIPKGSGDYRFVMYGHGTGGSYHDSAFDAEISALGASKVGIQFYGWTDKDVIDTFVSFSSMMKATSRSTGRLMQAVADGAAIQAAMTGALGDVLSAPTLGTEPNPAAGRRPDASIPIVAGGSLGGTMGLVYASTDPKMNSAVLNVPGAGWTHFIPGSNLYATIQALFRGSYGSDLFINMTLAASQTNWDDIDGAAWVDVRAGRPFVSLIQESIGDPVLPNAGSELVAVTTSADMVGKALVPIYGISQADSAKGKSGITQYRVSDTDALDVHGFAARNTPAGAAAREQIGAFLQSVWSGAPAITVPSGCTTGTPDGSCDFSK